MPLAGAIVVAADDRDPGLAICQQRNIPLVAVDHGAFDEVSDTVSIDNVGAAHEAVTHLIANGYSRIGIIAGPRYTMTGRDRLVGYRLALQEAGIPSDPDLEVVGPYGEDVGYDGMCHLLDLPWPVEALFTTNDEMTSGALRALHDRNLRVPDDLAVVGFDERETAGTPSLTCVLQPTVAMGRIAANLLIRRLEHPKLHVRQQIVLQHQLKIGNTSPPHVSRQSPAPS
jgi:DNA-binding LacI/PurR family transcriptional regulator